MRNLKKVLTLVLTVAMLLSIMVVGTGAAFSDQSSIKNTEAVDVCSALNIIGGFPDGSYRPTNNVTRGEMCKMICVALNGGLEPTLGTNNTPTFNDVRGGSGAWAESYIESCYSQGIVSGVGSGRFNPNGSVTGTQAARMLLVTLGYRADIQKYTGDAWAVNVNVDASARGLYEGLESIDANAALSRDNAAQMIWNALQAREVEYVNTLVTDSNGALTSQATVRDKVVEGNTDYITLLRDKYNAYIDMGTLTAINGNALTISVNSNDNIENDHKLASGATTGTLGFSKLTNDYSSLMGNKVKVVTKNGKWNEVLGVFATDDNTVYTTVANALDDSNGKIKFDDKTYSVEYTKTKGNTTTGTTGLATYRDGAEANALDVADLSNMVTSADKVILIDSDNNGKIDTVCINTVAVAKVTYASSTQIVAGGTTYKYEDDHIADGIAKNDWVVITENLFDECKDIVELEKINGTINGYRNKTSYHQYAVDGTWYNTADAKTLDTSAGDKAEAVVYNGIIFFGDKTSAGSDANNVCIVLEKGTFGQCKLAFFDGTATKTVTLSDDSVATTAGTAYVYEMDGDEYKLSTLNATNLDDEDYTVQTTRALQSAANTAVTGSNSAKYIDNVAIADNAKVQIVYGSSSAYKAKMITGKQFKTLVWDTLSSPSGTAIASLYSKVDGLTKVSVLAVNVGTVEPGSFQTNDKYAVVVSDSYKYDSDYIAYKVFDGTNEPILVTEKTSSARATGDIVGYSTITDENVIKDVTRYASSSTANSTTAGVYSVGAIQGVNDKGDQITVDGTNTFKVTSDTKIIFVDSDADNNKDDFAGVVSDATTVDKAYEADEIAGSGMYYYNIAYILDGNVSNGEADLAVLVIDVKGRMANTAETAQTVSTLTGCTATIDNTAVVAGTTTLPKGEVMVVKATAAGTMALTNAKFNDGTASKTVAVNDLVEVYADGVGSISVVVS